MGMSGISKSSVSKLCKDIDERVNAFLKRPLSGEWPYLWLDATYLKVREGGRIVSVAAIIAVAVTTEGKREIVGLHIGPSEAEPFWTTFLRDLAKRGLKGVKLVISDAHEGLKNATSVTTVARWPVALPSVVTMLDPARSISGRCRSIGGAAAREVEHGGGGEAVFARYQPRHHAGSLLDLQEAAAGDTREHVVDVLLRYLREDRRAG